jgi:hypothetical protein
MKRCALLSVLALLLLSACAPSAEAIRTAVVQTQAVATPETFNSRVNKLLEEGSTLSVLTAQGASFEEFSQQLAKAKEAYSLALAAQTAERNIPPEAIAELDLTFTGWDLAYSVWDAQLHGGGAPHAPDAVRYAELVSYVGLEQLPVVDSGSGSTVDQDQVISILLDLATEHFNAAQSLLLAEMR